MKGKQILIALGVLVLLSAYFYIFDVKKKQDEKKAKEESSVVFPGVSTDGITGLTVKTNDSKVTVKKTSEGWDMTEPLKVPADKHIVESISRHMAVMKYDRKIEGAVPADYSLNTASVYVSFETADGKKGVFYMSGLSPTGLYAYGYKEGENSAVYLVAKDVRLDCDKSITDFRYKGVLRYNTQTVTKIEVNLKDKKYTLEKQGSDWYVTKPVYKLAKKDRAEPLLDYFINSNVKAFYPESDAGKYGLVNPAEYIKVFDGKTEQTVYFGNMNKKNASAFVKTGLQPWVVEVPDYIYLTGASNLNEVYNKQIAVFKMEEAEELEVRYGEKYIKSVRNEKGKMPDWLVKEMKGIDKEKNKTFNASTLMGSIFWAEFKKEIKNPERLKEASEYGVSPAFAEIIIKAKDDRVTAHLMLGAKYEGGDMYVKNVLSNTVYLIPESVLTNMRIPELEIK